MTLIPPKQMDPIGIKVWHDDVRPAPSGWFWARTNEDAQAALCEYHVSEISLDHDLGFHDVVLPEDPDELAEVLILKGDDGPTGLDLCKWMVEWDKFPPVITIHSWNPDGARAMAALLSEHAPAGTSLTISPFNLNVPR